MSEVKEREQAGLTERDALLQALRLSMNSMLTLARLLAENDENTLSAKQIDYAQTIYSAGTDLLGVIDELVGEVESGGLAPAPAEASGAVRTMIGPAPFLRRRDLAARQPYRGRRSRRPDDGIVLIAHRDAALASALLERVRANGYEGRAVTDLAAARALLREHCPDAIIVGTSLSDDEGWAVIEQLCSDPETRRLPISMISSAHEGRHACLELACGAQALDALAGANAFDGIRKAMAGDASGMLETEAAIMTRGRDGEQILRQAARFLHEVLGTPLPRRRRIQLRRRRSALDLVGKKVLIVDGDMRDVYAMTGALEQQGVLVMHAENGEQGVRMLENNPDTDAALVDTALSAADGSRTIRLMRAQAGARTMPIVALTGQIEPGSREAYLAAGASDCLAKPVDPDRLIALLRAWLLTPR